MPTPTKSPSRPRKAAAPRKTASPTAAAVAHDDSVVNTMPPSIDSVTLLFDPDWYRTSYPDVAQAGIDPIRHYFDNGAREGRDPNPHFSTSSYVDRYADVAASRMNPFLHYLLYGAREGRSPKG